MATTLIGTPVNWVDGRKKVTGTAQYAAEIVLGEMCHAVLIGSPKAGGRIRSLNAKAAEHAPGVLLVLTHQNAGKFGDMPDDMQKGGTTAEKRQPLADDRILHAGQYVAIVVAEELEQARHAASLIQVDYEAGNFAVVLEDAEESRYKPKEFMGEPLTFQRGDLEAGFKAADVSSRRHMSRPRNTPAPWSLMPP